MPTYQTTNPLARANPLRSVAMFRPAAEVLRKPVALYTVPGLVAQWIRIGSRRRRWC